MNTRYSALRWLVALAVISASGWYILVQFNWPAVISTLNEARWFWFLIASACLFFLNIAVRTMRWKLLLTGMGESISFRQLYLPTMIFISLSMMTPGQIGEVLKVKALSSRTTVRLIPGMGVFVIERLLDALVVLILAVSGIIFIRLNPSDPMFMMILAGLCALMAGGIWFLSQCKLPVWTEKLAQNTKLARQGAVSLLGSFSLTLAAWLSVVLSWQVALECYGVSLTLPESIALTGITTLGIIVSFVPGGLGVSEVLISELLMKFGIGEIESQAGALMVRILGLWWILIGVFHIAWWAVAGASKQELKS